MFGLETTTTSVTVSSQLFGSNRKSIALAFRSSATGTTFATTSNRYDVAALSLTTYATDSRNPFATSSIFSRTANRAVSPGATTCDRGPEARRASEASPNSTRTMIARSEPLVAEKYLTCSLPTLTSPKSTVPGPNTSFAISFGINTRAQSTRSALVVGRSGNALAPPYTKRSSHSTACCGR